MIKTLDINTYSQSSQYNPIEFMLMKKTDDGYINTTNWFRCRDFFNDVVAGRLGHFFSVYGFNNKIEYDEEGLYVLVQNILDSVIFLQNIETVVNGALKKSSLNVQVRIIDSEDGTIIFIPKELLTKTYYVSLVTWLIRISNSIVEAVDLKTYTRTVRDNIDLDKKIQKYMFDLPEKLLPYWYFYDKKYNSETLNRIDATMIHDCGMDNFVRLV